MALALCERKIETELCWLDADLRRKSARANLIKESEVVIAHCDCGVSTGDRFAELCEDQTATACGDHCTRRERLIGVLARHERPRRALHKRTPQSEIVEPPASRRCQQDRTSERHVRAPRN